MKNYQNIETNTRQLFKPHSHENIRSKGPPFLPSSFYTYTPFRFCIFCLQLMENCGLIILDKKPFWYDDSYYLTTNYYYCVNRSIKQHTGLIPWISKDWFAKKEEGVFIIKTKIKKKNPLIIFSTLFLLTVVCCLLIFLQFWSSYLKKRIPHFAFLFIYNLRRQNR